MAAFDSYTTLKAAIVDLVLYAGGVSSGSFDVEGAIQLCEARLKRDLRHHRMITRSTATLDSRTFAVPTNWLQTIRMSITSPTRSTLQLASLDELMDRSDANADVAGRPFLYAHVGEEFEVWPTPDDDYTVECLHYAFPTVLSAGNASNWILVHLPDLYFYGSLIMTEAINKSDERMVIWKQAFDEALASANNSSRQAQSSGSGMRVRFR